MKENNNDQETVIVTGASSGIGLATARELAKRGYHVFAGVRREQDAQAIVMQNIEPVIIDITKPEHIVRLLAKVNGDPQCRPLRALINNAGVAINVPVEVFAIERWRHLFEVNFFGHIAVTQALLPTLIKSKGRVINVSSVGGKIAMATYGPYASTKFALEATSDSLRREISKDGVHVVVIEPGAVRTEMADRAIKSAKETASNMTLQQNQRYDDLIQAVNAQTTHHTDLGLSADAAAKVVVKAVTTRKPRTRYSIGRDAALMKVLVRLLPDRALDYMLSKALTLHLPKVR